MACTHGRNFIADGPFRLEPCHFASRIQHQGAGKARFDEAVIKTRLQKNPALLAPSLTLPCTCRCSDTGRTNEDVVAALELALLYVENIAKNPTEAKFRKVGLPPPAMCPDDAV
jgi:hypothetical protein